MIFNMDYLYIFFSKRKKSLADRLYSTLRLKKYSHAGIILWSFDKAVESTKTHGVEINTISKYNSSHDVPIFRLDVKTIKNFSTKEYSLRLLTFIKEIEKSVDLKLWRESNKCCCEFVHDIIKDNFHIDLNQFEQELSPDVLKNSRYLNYIGSFKVDSNKVEQKNKQKD